MEEQKREESDSMEVSKEMLCLPKKNFRGKIHLPSTAMKLRNRCSEFFWTKKKVPCHPANNLAVSQGSRDHKRKERRETELTSMPFSSAMSAAPVPPKSATASASAGLSVCPSAKWSGVLRLLSTLVVPPGYPATTNSNTSYDASFAHA